MKVRNLVLVILVSIVLMGGCSFLGSNTNNKEEVLTAQKELNMFATQILLDFWRTMGSTDQPDIFALEIIKGVEKGEYTFTEISVTKKEQTQLILSGHKYKAQQYLQRLRGFEADSLVKEIYQEASEYGFLLEDINTSEKELQKFLNFYTK